MSFSVFFSWSLLLAFRGWWLLLYVILRVYASWYVLTKETLLVISDHDTAFTQRRDSGWFVLISLIIEIFNFIIFCRIHTCLEEAENERMHLMCELFVLY
jgi:hypothetical protein